MSAVAEQVMLENPLPASRFSALIGPLTVSRPRMALRRGQDGGTFLPIESSFQER